MGTKYCVTGVQLGMLEAFIELGKIKEAEKLLDKILKEQALYNGYEWWTNNKSVRPLRIQRGGKKK